MDSLSLFKELIKIDTTNSKNSDRVISLISNYLSKDPIIIESNGIKNAIFIKGDSKDAFVLCGHYDVVPVIGKWSVDPFSAYEKDGFIYGRGASDMKSGLAMLVEAFRRIDDSSNRSLILMVVGDEEKGGVNGALPSLKFLLDKGYSFYRYLGAEPMFQDRPFSSFKVGRRGIMHVKIEFKGKSSHAAVEDEAKNPIYYLPKIIPLIKSIPLNDKPDMINTSIAITNISTNNKAVNVTPSLLTIGLDIRYNYGNKEQEIINALHSSLSTLNIEFNIIKEELPYTISFMNKDSSYSSLLKEVTKEITGIEPKPTTIGGSSDARFFASELLNNIPGILEFGPTSYNAHSNDEKVNINEMLVFADIYEEIIKRSIL